MTSRAHLILVIAIALVIGIGVHLQNRGGDDKVIDPAAASILALRLPDHAGVIQSVAQWRSKIIIANYWATWCPPCRKEIPDFVALSHDFAGDPVQIVGISIDDADKVQAFRDEYAIPYPLLIASEQVLKETYKFGNTAKALPFTVIIDRRGTVRHIKVGLATRDEIGGKVRALLNETN
ncbi:MAG: TlpA family protein disulfide reductase [Azoarcus sp.]|jgi:peroxiredoxin|nr:TlpA family protein disulfide reductase [Azoarcus sp.]